MQPRGELNRYRVGLLRGSTARIQGTTEGHDGALAEEDVLRRTEGRAASRRHAGLWVLNGRVSGKAARQGRFSGVVRGRWMEP